MIKIFSDGGHRRKWFYFIHFTNQSFLRYRFPIISRRAKRCSIPFFSTVDHYKYFRSIHRLEQEGGGKFLFITKFSSTRPPPPARICASILDLRKPSSKIRNDCESVSSSYRSQSYTLFFVPTTLSCKAFCQTGVTQLTTRLVLRPTTEAMFIRDCQVTDWSVDSRSDLTFGQVCPAWFSLGFPRRLGENSYLLWRGIGEELYVSDWGRIDDREHSTALVDLCLSQFSLVS